MLAPIDRELRPTSAIPTTVGSLSRRDASRTPIARVSARVRQQREREGARRNKLPSVATPHAGPSSAAFHLGRTVHGKPMALVEAAASGRATPARTPAWRRVLLRCRPTQRSSKPGSAPRPDGLCWRPLRPRAARPLGGRPFPTLPTPCPGAILSSKCPATRRRSPASSTPGTTARRP